VVGFFGELFFRMFTSLSWNSSGGPSWGSSSSRSSSSSSSSDSDSKGSGGGAIIVVIIAIALIMLAWLLSQVVKLALSRSRELLADAGSVELTKNPDAMISALRKIEGRGELPGATSAVMELCLDNPREGFADLFATHPSVQSRVDALVKFAGGHDPGPLPPPADETDQPETDEPEAQADPQNAPPPVPHGPWNDAGSPHGPPPVPAPSPAGTAASNPLGPIGNPIGPWGRH
jgi:heat shock protein HtpX